MNGTTLRLLTLEIRLEHDVVLCRLRARQLAESFGFDPQDQTRIATAVSEIVRNAFDYAKGGKIDFAVATTRRPSKGRASSEQQSLVITVRDQGPGIREPGERPASLGLGLGLTGARRLMDTMDVVTQPGATTITMTKVFPTGTPQRSAPQLQAVVDRIAKEPPPGPLAELQVQNQELIRALDEVRARQEDIARINQELADTNAGVLALYDELETLHRVGVLLASQLDLKTLLQAITDATTDLTDAQFGAFFYREETSGAWLLHATAGSAREALTSLPTPYDADLFDIVSGVPIPGTQPAVNAGPDSKFARALGKGFELNSCLMIPVASEAETLGALVFGSSDPKAFTERNERIVGSIAAQAVIGIEKARLFEKVQNSSAAKDRFLAMLSHELRTPLNPVLAVVSNLVSDHRLPMDVQQDLNVVLRNVRLEARLIDDLLDFSRIINGKLQLHREQLDLHTLIRSVVDICAEDIARGSHTVTLALNAPRSSVLGDSARLQQVLWNVLKNAVKFTPALGRISIRTELIEGDTVEVTIADSGVGIEPAALARIFSAFEQGGLETNARFGGLGLGLAITKAFVELHGGTIHARSAGVGTGTQVTIRLPLLENDKKLDPSAAGNFPAATTEKTAGTLLLVDDHLDTLNVMSRLLIRQGYRVITASSYREAIDAARRDRVDLIVSDLGLPDGSGLELLGALRQYCAGPAIALSGYGMEEDVKQSRSAGFSEHLTKPIDFPVLTRTIARLLENAAETK